MTVFPRLRRPLRSRTTGTLSALGLVLTLCLSGCSTDRPNPAAAGDGSSAPATVVDADLLADLGLAGMSGREIVELLDRSTEERPLALGASVREDHVLVSDGTRETAVPLPPDLHYVSVAPFLEQTHECFHHSLATCRGELAEEVVSVVVTGEDGDVLVDETVTTGTNGFTGFWLPRGIEAGRLDVARDGHEGSVPLSTTPGSPTCVTTLQLVPSQT